MREQDVELLIRKYLKQKETAQLATLKGDQPWISTIYYVADDDCNIYWTSQAHRRHSQEIHDHSKAAIAIAVQFPGHPVIGLQIEGDAELLEEPNELAEPMKLYIKKFGDSQKFYEEVLAGKSSHKLYRLKPRLIVLFDEEHFPENSRQEWQSQ